jgi:hypothetical protein
MTRVPSEEEVEAIMQLGDAGPLPIPSIFPYVDGMPVIVNQNKYLGPKVANGSEFTAVGIVPDPNVQEHVVGEGLSIFFGPPCGILLQYQELRGVRVPYLPPDTIMRVGSATEGRAWKAHMPGPVLKARISNGSVEARSALCSRFVLMDYKSQSRTMGRVLLGLYGRSGDDKCDIIYMYVELSQCEELEKIRLFQPLRAKDFMESRMHPYLNT